MRETIFGAKRIDARSRWAARRRALFLLDDFGMPANFG
jgi:hypothetical protein